MTTKEEKKGKHGRRRGVNDCISEGCKIPQNLVFMLSVELTITINLPINDMIMKESENTAKTQKLLLTMNS